MKHSDNNYVNHIKAKPKKDIALGLIPVVGNLAIATLNLTRWENEKPKRNFNHNRQEINNLLQKKGILSEELTVHDSIVPKDKKYTQDELKDLLIALLKEKAEKSSTQTTTAIADLDSSTRNNQDSVRESLQRYFAATKDEEEQQAPYKALIQKLQSNT